MEDSKDQIKESSGSFNKPEPIEKKTFNDLMRLKLEIDYQQLPMIDTDLLEKVMEASRESLSVMLINMRIEFSF